MVGVHLGAAYGPAKLWLRGAGGRALSAAGLRGCHTPSCSGAPDEAEAAADAGSGADGEPGRARSARRSCPRYCGDRRRRSAATPVSRTWPRRSASRRHALRADRPAAERATRSSLGRTPRGAVRAVLLPQRARSSIPACARHVPALTSVGRARWPRPPGGDVLVTAPLTILHLAANRWWTGSADPIIHLVAGLRARGHRVLLGVIPGDRFEVKAKRGRPAAGRGPPLRARPSRVPLMRDVPGCGRSFASESVDIVHAHHSHDHWLSVLIAAQRAQGGRTPVVRTFHNPAR